MEHFKVSPFMISFEIWEAGEVGCNGVQDISKHYEPLHYELLHILKDNNEKER